jgi:mono/diheme cytochrome c family protein
MRRAAVAALALCACRTDQTLVAPDPQLDRMLVQEKVLPYGSTPALPHGMAMQAPPLATLPVDTIVDDPRVTEGAAQGHFADRVPVVVDRALVTEGETHFERFCATCHGSLGDGVSIVAANMALRKPPSLLTPEIRAYPPGRLYQTSRHGYGLMPSYAAELAVPEAWGVVAYVRALQWARGIPVSDLPGDARAKLASEAP